MKKNSIYIYFLSHFLFLGGGFAKICSLSNKDTVLSFILGTLLGIILVYIISKLSSSKKDSFFFKIIYFIYILFNIFIILVILSNFLSSYFLLYTPSIISCMPFIILASHLASKKIKGIYNVAFVLFYFSLFIITIKTLLLTNEFNYNNVLPILSVSTSKVIKSSFLYAFISCSPLLIFINDSMDFKSNLKYYLLASLTNIIVALTITFILGEMVNVYSYPEYTILRRIRFFNFIENIENFICINWFFDLFISLSIFILKLKNTLNVKHNIIPFLISFSILYIVYTFFSNNFYNTIILYNIFPYICGGFIGIFIIFYSIKFLNFKLKR